MDERTLLEYMQYRNSAFNTQSHQKQLASLSPSELDQLKNSFIREEALYREALKLQMDSSDYVIKQRMIQKMEYLAQGFQPDTDDLTEQNLQQFYEGNRQRYNEPATLTFTHVFVDPKRDEGNVHERATALLANLRENQVPFSESTRHGDRFIYHANYVERPTDFIGSHFGTDFAAQLMTLKPEDGVWHGPIPSTHGLHLVMVARHKPGGIPPLNAIRDQVTRDAEQARLRAHTEEAIRRIIDNYEVDDRLTALTEDNNVAARE